ncbi:ribonuclease P protein component [Amycolatopsis jejuensis]|uniref:ribonuclease P protein component n=1 Tax=Amycolatopsis jejuensis TaxID=330084 RepID=UPI0005267C83|nr:ribonuclease P protein component [Amycolatopsis jejuensis]
MLPAAARLRRSEDFRVVLRRGSRAGRRRLVVHALTTDPSVAVPATARAGFVVSKAVGNSVVRHRVTRQLRHLVSARLGTLPAGSSLVVRALPPAAAASSAELGADLDAALRRLGLPAPGSDAPRQPRQQGTAPDHGSAV